MNRVRIVAVGAVALGATVFAGTKFQQQRDIEAFQQHQLAAAQTDDASLLAAQSPALAAAEPSVSLTENVSIQTFALAGDMSDGPSPVVVDQVASEQNPQALVTASALSIMPQSEDDEALTQVASADTVEPNEASLLLAQISQTTQAEPQDPAVSAASVVPGSVGVTGSLSSLAEPALSAPTPAAGQLVQSTSTDPVPAQSPTVDTELAEELNSCAVWLVATPMATAMMEVSVYAPCDAGQVVEMSHAGMKFDARIGDDSQLMLQVPALAESATVALTFADGRTHSDTTEVADVSMYERAVLQSRAPAVLGLNAYEFGASFGDAGHVRADNPRDPGISGYLTVLGDATIENGHVSQIYTYPIGITQSSDAVALEIEAAITSASCGHQVEATALGMQSGIVLQERAINMTMPDCDGAGGYVVLQDVLPEQSVAMN